MNDNSKSTIEKSLSWYAHHDRVGISIDLIIRSLEKTIIGKCQNMWLEVPMEK